MSSGTGSIYKQKGSSRWWISYYHNGKRYRESSGSDRKKDAKDLLQKRLGAIGQGLPVGPGPERVTFDDLETMILEDYRANERKSLRRLRSSLKQLRPHLGGLRAVEITTERVNRYIAERRANGAANATIQKETAALKRMFRLAKQAGQVSSIPHLPVPRVRNVRQHFLTSDDVEAIVSRLPTYLRPVVRFAVLTGWRKGEILQLRWADVDFVHGTIHLRPGTTKNDEGRTFPFRALPPLQDLLEQQRDRTRALERSTSAIVSHVFHRKGKPIRSMRTAWGNACRAAGLGDAWFHDLRRTAVMSLERAGVPRSTAMKLTGHKTEGVYRRYAIADLAALEEGVGKLARLHTSGFEHGGRRSPEHPVPSPNESTDTDGAYA